MVAHSSCSACAWVTEQLGSTTPCPFHAGDLTPDRSLAMDQVTEWCLAAARPTIDRPWPFTPREYARLLVLRGRVQERYETGAPARTGRN